MKDDLFDLKQDSSDDDENTKTKKKKISEKEEKNGSIRSRNCTIKNRIG